MFRTRDFILIFTAVAFLLMAITVTVFNKQTATSTSLTPNMQFAEQIVSDEPAVLLSPDNLSRSERLQTMRAKIAASEQLSITNEPPQFETEAEATSSEQVVVESEKTLQLCGNYRAAGLAWSPAGIEIEEVEGARIVYREGERNTVPNSNASSSQSQPMVESYQDVVLTLPVRSFPAATPSCIPTDVIGIANDGSLIRNTEAGVYGIFGANTVVGYALDGFPIYGTGAAATDACGGIMGVAGYQYQISADRETIINCFAAPPVSI